ncbi:hypothetical protein D3C85_1593330 [compost metagenome]
MHTRMLAGQTVGDTQIGLPGVNTGEGSIGLDGELQARPQAAQCVDMRGQPARGERGYTQNSQPALLFVPGQMRTGIGEDLQCLCSRLEVRKPRRGQRNPAGRALQ